MKISRQTVRQQFNRIAQVNAERFLDHEIGQRLLDRLELIKINPAIILDVGCADGWMAKEIQQRFPAAKILGVDIAEQQLTVAQDLIPIQADTTKLPLQDRSVDFIIANLSLPWCDDIKSVIAEWYRVLKYDGLLLFSNFGPDTLKEVRQAWANVDQAAHVPIFFDMHDIGDQLLQVGLSDPVVDVERLFLSYDNTEDMLTDFKQQGLRNILVNRQAGLMGKNKFQQFLQQLQVIALTNGTFNLSLEIMFGHAWKLQKTHFEQEENEFYFDIEKLRRNK